MKRAPGCSSIRVLSGFLSCGQSWPLAIVVGAVALGCATSSARSGVPLYAGAEVTRPPRSDVAEVIGPIAKVDGRDVADRGGWFELRPGCHVVELDRRPPNDVGLSSAVYFTGQFPLTTYVLRMKPGARYVIRRQLTSDGSTGTLSLWAGEEEASGATHDLSPMQSVDEIQACKQWAATTLGP
jgi:hypothetical protein